eukprot:scaffold21214_cov63-Attheya_sp.AAC.1
MYQGRIENRSPPHRREGTILPIYRDCFDSGMCLVFSAKATNFKMKGQEDKLNKEKKRKNWKQQGKGNAESFEQNNWEANGIF